MGAQQIGAMFQRAALQPEQWIDALDAMASATNSYRGQLIGIGGDRAVPFNWVTHADSTILSDFVEIDGGNPSVSFRVAAGAHADIGEVVAEDMYATLRARIGDNAYEDFCKRFDLPFGAQAIVARDAGRMIGLAVLRARSDGKSSAADRALFGDLVPYVRAAVDLQTAVEGRGTQLMLGAYDAISTAAILIDGFGRVPGMTPTAEAALRQLPHLDVVRGAFRCRTQRDGHALSQGISTVLRDAVASVDLLLRGDGDRPLALSIHRLPVMEWSLSYVPRAIVVLRTRAASSENMLSLLQRAYGLTRAEAEIAVAVGTGDDRRDIAEMRGVSLGTVRQQLKSIYGKLGVHRETELLALLGAIAGG